MYVVLDFVISPFQPASEILIAELSVLGFESFMETDTGLQAFIPESAWDKAILDKIRILQSGEFQIHYQITKIARQNWNAIWERSFEPIAVGRECLVRAPFHKPSGADFEIVIEPKMSFGTGHHETTFLMLRALLELDVKDHSVLDMGCGTGVLAILAAMKGAAAVEAIDIDPWSYTNTLENARRNQQQQIRVREGDAGLLHPASFDIILANINRNILLQDIPNYAKSLRPEGTLLVSGFYLEDLPAISEKCMEVNLIFEKNTVKNHWVSAKYVF